LGAQSAVAGGGRYDGLVKELGGPQTPAIGFAIGFDRLVEIMEQIDNKKEARSIDLFIVSLGDLAMEKGYHWSSELNQAGIRTEMDFRGKSMKALMKRADKLKAQYVLIAREDELKKKTVVIRNMNTKEQVLLAIETLVPELIKIFNK
jgi:histidyl-tRNA synthetase